MEAKRPARTLREAVALTSFRGKVLTNARTGIQAVISGGNIAKMVSPEGLAPLSSPTIPSAVIANAHTVFERATFAWEHDDRHGDQDVDKVMRFLAPILVPSDRQSWPASPWNG